MSRDFAGAAMMAKTLKPVRYKPSHWAPTPWRADFFAESSRKPSCACGGACAKCREERAARSEPHALANSDHSWDHPVPAIVGEVLNSPGEPLDLDARAVMEPLFGHDFAKVRVYNDAHAAESARALHALAYTVGPKIVFGAHQYAPGLASGQRLLAHELTHVVKEAHGTQVGIQRQDEEKQKPTPTRDKYLQEILCGRGGGGLFGRPHVNELFRFSGTFFTNPADVAGAEIEDTRTGKRDLYYVGNWLGDEWQIVDIGLNHATVVNATCGTEETLRLEKSEPTPQVSLIVNETNFGAGVVKIYDDFKRVVFEPAENSKPTREYKLETLRKEGLPPLTAYVLEGGAGTLIPPPDLENILGLHLVGEKRGTPKPKGPEETWEDLTTLRP